MSSADVVFENAARVHVIRVLSEDACARLIARAEVADAWDDSPAYSFSAEGNAAEVETRVSRSILERDRPDVFADVRPVVEQTFARFTGEGASPRFVLSRFEVIRYEVGGNFPLHRDTRVGNTRRRYSFLAYLNDDFEGGATAFPMIGRTLRPLRGQGILFPSPYLHAGEQVVSGRKYVLTGYLGDLTTEPDWF